MKSVLISIQPYWVFLIIAKTMGWEIEPKWVKVANDRLNKTDANGQQCMFLK